MSIGASGADVTPENARKSTKARRGRAKKQKKEEGEGGCGDAWLIHEIRPVCTQCRQALRTRKIGMPA